MKILLTGGGSGGHFYPLIAVAEEINRISKEERLIKAELFFMSDSSYDEKALFANDIQFLKIPAGKMRTYFSINNVLDVFKTLTGMIIAFKTVFKIYPDVVFGKGGYASFPALFAARLLGIPVFIHESDSVPGRVNKWAGKFALRSAVSFPEAAVYFPKDRTAWTGNPVRSDIKQPIQSGAAEAFGFDPSIPTIFIIGGSLGSEKINNAVLEALPELVKTYQIIHQTGRNNYKDVSSISSVALKNSAHKNRYKCLAFLDNEELRNAAGAASLVISRAGSSLFEIAMWQKPSILIPITKTNGDHQKKNAIAYEKSGACSVLEEINLKPHILLSEISRILSDKNLCEEMKKSAGKFSKPDAAEKIAREILNIALSHEK